MAHCHDIAAYSIQEEKRGKVYQEEDIFAQVMVEEDLFPEDDGYDMVLNNAVFISPITKPLPSPPVHKLNVNKHEDEPKEEEEVRNETRDDEEEAYESHPATLGADVSTCPHIPRLSLVPQKNSEQEDMTLNNHSDHCADDGLGSGRAGDDGGEERGRKVKSPRGEGVDVLGMADDEQDHQNHQESAAPARRRLPPGAVGYGNIVPTHFELRKTNGPNNRQKATKAFDRETITERPEFMRVVLAGRSVPTSPRSPTYEMDIGSSSSTASAAYKAKHGSAVKTDDDLNLSAAKKWPVGRRRAETDAGRSSSGGAHEAYESFPRPSLGSAKSSMSRAEQERRVRKESMEYIECPLPPMPESEWWDGDGDKDATTAQYDDVDINGDGDELAPTTPQPDGAVHRALGGKGKNGKCADGIGSSKSAISYVDEERRRKKCVVQ